MAPCCAVGPQSRSTPLSGGCWASTGPLLAGFFGGGGGAGGDEVYSTLKGAGDFSFKAVIR